MTTTTTTITLTRISNDVNGNSRHVAHFLDTLPPNLVAPLGSLYEHALARAKKHGGKKYHCRAYGGGIVFQGPASNVAQTVEALRALA